MDSVLVVGIAVAIVLHAWAYFLRSRGAAKTDLTRLQTLPPPWGDRPAIYAHVRSHLHPSGAGLTSGGEDLPDEDRFAVGGLRWAAGVLDALVGPHASAEDRAVSPWRVVAAIKDATTLPSAQTLRHAYDLLSHHRALAHVDALMREVVTGKELDPGRLKTFARWLVLRAADRDAVKMGIALLGLARGDERDRDLLLTIGRHEEFTLYAAVALVNSLDAPEPALFELAKSVHGWGRIRTVERLAGAKDPRVRRWLVREGYRNSILYDYLAHVCATAGGLREELEAPDVDDALLDGASDILRTLIEGEGRVAAGMDAYADGPAAATQYLRHVGRRLSSAPLRHLLAVSALTRFVDDAKGDEDARAERGWTPEVRRELRARGEALIAAPRWRALVDEGLASADGASFHEASKAAKVLEIETWDAHFARASASGDLASWLELSRTPDRERMARVVDLAESRLLVDDISTGPATSLDPGWRPVAGLDLVLQELDRFPGLGWNLIRAALYSSSVRDRNMALRALSAWGEPHWPAEARAIVANASELERDAQVRDRFDRVLEGRPLED